MFDVGSYCVDCYLFIYFADAHTARIANVLLCCCFAEYKYYDCVLTPRMFFSSFLRYFPQLASTPV